MLFLFVLLPFALASDPTTTKNTLFPNGIGDFFNPPMMKLPVAGYTVKQWPWGTLPKTCFDQAPKDGGNYCNIYDIDVFDVTYNDCPQPWTICRCHNAQQSATTVFDHIGRIPVKARQEVRHFSAYGGPGWAYSNGEDLTFFGDWTGAPTGYFHELGHNLDGRVARENGGSFTQGPTWAKAVAADTCVPDSYAQVSYAEDWAQLTNFVKYDADISSVWNIPNVGCAANQVGTIIQQLWGVLHYDANAKCDHHLEDTDGPVCMGDAARNSGACVSIPEKKTLVEEKNGVKIVYDALTPEQRAVAEERVKEAIRLGENGTNVPSVVRKRSDKAFWA